jgi:hypothetical protein
MMKSEYNTLLSTIGSLQSKAELYAVLDAITWRLRELDDIPPGWVSDAELKELLERRSAEVIQGTIATIPGEEVMDELRKLAP